MQVGFYSTSGFSKSKFVRTKHNVRGEFLGWHIVNTETWQRQLIESLSSEQKKLSPLGIWNDTLLIENLINYWSLENWIYFFYLSTSKIINFERSKPSSSVQASVFGYADFQFA